MSASQENTGLVRKSFWIVFAFYFLIAFEFFYMVSPFAIYFYSVYEPGLSFITKSTALGWLSTTFLPHFAAHSSSQLLKVVMFIGMILSVAGFVLFLAGAVQVYYAKLTRKKVVIGGVYRYIRHPQYAALAIAGFGLLILWPRYLVLISYITMLFFYYLLARAEEKECERKFGESYRRYLNSTGMFLPIRFKIIKPFKILPRPLGMVAGYIVFCVLGVTMAHQLRGWSLDQIYALYENDSVTISVTRLDKEEISELLTLAQNDSEVRYRLEMAKNGPAKYLNYILPVDWSASEIPMNPVDKRVENPGGPHGYPLDKKIEKYKIVFTQAVQINGNHSTGKTIMSNTSTLIPLLEVVIDLPGRKVVEINDPVEDYRLRGIPLPLY